MRGFTLIELLVAMGILAILLGIAAVSMRGLDNPLNDAVQQVSGSLKQSRLKAMSNTNAYRVKPASSTQLSVEYANNCAASTWTHATAFERSLPEGIIFNSTAWSVCFNSRGLADSAINVVLVRQKDNKQRSIQVLLGGAVVQP